jgi:plastocyanin
MGRIVRVVAAGALGAALLAGCGDDGGDGTSQADTPVALEGDVNDEGSADATRQSELELEADDFYFEPTFVKASPGETLTVTVTNEGDATHTFTIDGTDVDVELEPGDTGEAEVPVPEDAAVVFYCRFHRGSGMQGAVYTKKGQTVGSSGGGSGRY